MPERWQECEGVNSGSLLLQSKYHFPQTTMYHNSRKQRRTSFHFSCYQKDKKGKKALTALKGTKPHSDDRYLRYSLYITFLLSACSPLPATLENARIHSPHTCHMTWRKNHLFITKCISDLKDSMKLCPLNSSECKLASPALLENGHLWPRGCTFLPALRCTFASCSLCQKGLLVTLWASFFNQ